MYSFQFELIDGEQILYLGKPVAGKDNQSIKDDIVALFFCVIMIALFVWMIVSHAFSGVMGIVGPILGILFIGLFLLLTINSIRNKKGGLDKLREKDEYCLTNLRVLVHKGDADELLAGSLKKYTHMEIEDGKDGYGSLVFINDQPEVEDDEIILVFECIKDPASVKKMAEDACAALLS